MSAGTPRRASARRSRGSIPRALLVAGEPFGSRLPAARVTAALAAGLRRGGRDEIDECPLQTQTADTPPAAQLDRLDFDRRMRRAHALILAARELEPRTLPGSLAFELATRARQSGVPAYAVTSRNRLEDFDARLLDLQVVLQARGAAALAAAGRELASLV